jgi:hypothetical protein
MAVGSVAEVRIRRYGSTPDCDVVIVLRGDEVSIRCRTYDDAVKWAQMECKSYRIAECVVEG